MMFHLINSKWFPHGKGRQIEHHLTLSVDDFIDFMRVVGILGVVLFHLETHGQVVQGTAEVGFPPGLVVGEVVYFTACFCPCL